ncbi:MAG: DUF2800 domain-containing protein [Corynebacterium glucuronolyticum]|nr:DUF2800 domain-containing protein [Mycobacteriaceae bacterium]MDY5834636.1 DUF2800 domain-containing protein [Corynebacterium glucuronolyticum]
MTDYIPLIYIQDIDIGDDADALKTTVKEQGLTHVRLKKGKKLEQDVYQLRSFDPILKKSVSTNIFTVGGQYARFPYERVESLGIMGPLTAQGDTPEQQKPAVKEEPAKAPEHHQRAHALLSASSAHRWLHCTPSPHLEERYEDSESPAAAEGTAAHELAEHKLHQRLEQSSERPESPLQNEDMDDHTDDYADRVMAELTQAKKTNPAAFLAIEQRLDFSHVVPDGFGTGDAVIIAEPTMTIIDLKYGKGVKVDAEGNPQMRLYALGALRQFGMIYNIQQVRMVIFQPRIGNISVDEVSVTDLLAWAEEVVKPAATKAIKGEGELTAGQWCQFCRHAPQCPALARHYLQPIPRKADETPAAPDPETLTDTQIAQIVEWSGDIKKWLTKVESYALDQANNGHAYPGLKLVEGRSVRKFTDQDAVAKKVEALGKDPWEKKLLGITAMTKLLGKKTFDAELGELIHKPAGKPTLVPVSDKRPELTPTSAETIFQPLEKGA